MNTEEACFPAEILKDHPKAEVHHVTKAEFDHGGTRDQGIRMSDADVVICMTQDAIPADEHMAGALLKTFDDPEVWAAYARQLPKENCREVEKYTRSFNYPEEEQNQRKRRSSDTWNQDFLLLQCVRGMETGQISGTGRICEADYF